VVATFRDLLEGRTLDNGTKRKLAPEQVSIRALWEGFVGDCDETLPSATGMSLISEAVDSSAFIAVTRLLLNAKVIDAYNQQPGIGDQLTTTIPATRRQENFAGFTEAEGLKDVAEGMPYEDSSVGDKYVTTDAGKKGRLISITEEAIQEDQTGQLLLRAQRIGENAKIDKEKLIIFAILDKNTNVWRPNGTPTTLYSTGNGNLMGIAGAVTGFTAAFPLTDWNDLESVELFHTLSIKDDRQVGTREPIMWNPGVMLIPKNLNSTALRILKATEIRLTTGASTRTIFSNPKANAYTPLTSPYIGTSGIAGATADWFVGDFKKQFVWREIWPIQTFKQDNTGPEGFLRDVVAIFKVRYLGGVAALDSRYVVKVKGS
jgi:hypothetical protein